METAIQKYKLRAECSADVVQFIQNAHNQLAGFAMHRSEELFPDVELEFETDLALDEIIFTLKDIEDSHVMVETVQPIDQYTGERNYDVLKQW